MRFKHKLTYFILISIIISAIFNGADYNWAAFSANIVALVGWLEVMGYEKKEREDETN